MTESKNLEEKLEEILKIFTHRFDEIEKRVMLLQRKIYGTEYENVFEYIREKVVVDKEELLKEFPFLQSRYKFNDFKKTLPPDIKYIYYQGTMLRKFVCIENIAVRKAVEYFFSTEYKDRIKVNSPDPKLNEEIMYWLERIFSGYITKSQAGNYYLKGVVEGVTKRGRRIIKKERRV